jgi:hypothetical protein
LFFELERTGNGMQSLIECGLTVAVFVIQGTKLVLL